MNANINYDEIPDTSAVQEDLLAALSSQHVTVHTNEEPDFDYMENGDVAFVVKNPHNDENLLIELGGEFSVFFGLALGGEFEQQNVAHRTRDLVDVGLDLVDLQRLGDAVVDLVPRDAAHAQRTRQRCDAGLQLLVGDTLGRKRDRAFMHDRDLIAATRQHMAVDRVPAGIDHAVGKPFEDRRAFVEQCL